MDYIIENIEFFVKLYGFGHSECDSVSKHMINYQIPYYWCDELFIMGVTFFYGIAIDVYEWSLQTGKGSHHIIPDFIKSTDLKNGGGGGIQLISMLRDKNHYYGLKSKGENNEIRLNLKVNPSICNIYKTG